MSASATEAGRGEPEVAKLSLPRRAMARNMAQTVDVPVFYLRVTADVTELLGTRRRLREADPSASDVPTVNDFVLRAVALALREHPVVNSSLVDDGVATYPRVNVSVAIATPGALVAPAVYDADRKDVRAIAADVRELAELAGRRRLSKEVLADGTFTVSNLGMFGIEDFDPVLNAPQAAILGVGTAMPAGDDRRTMRLTLGCDHRVLTGAEAAPFLVAVRDRLQEPETLLSDPLDHGDSE